MKIFTKIIGVAAIFLLISGNSFAGNVTGKVVYMGDANSPLANVTVYLTSGSGTRTTLTDKTGAYSFTADPGTYTLSGKAEFKPGGVNIQDAVMVLKAITGRIKLTPIQQLTADVDGSGSINMYDFNLILKHILFGTKFPVGDWVFEKVNFQLNNTKAADGQPGGFSGGATGDLGGVFIPNLFDDPLATDFKSAQTNSTTETTEKIVSSKGEEVTVDLVSKESLSFNATSLVLNIPSGKLKVTSVNFAGRDYEYSVLNDQVRLTWINGESNPLTISAGQPILSLKCVLANGANVGEKIVLSLDDITSIVGTDEKEYKNLKFGLPVVEVKKPEIKLSNYPNPFVSTTTVEYTLPEEGNVMVAIYNIGGQQVKTFNEGFKEPGVNTLMIDCSDLPSGKYFCRLSVNGKSGASITKQLIKVN